MISYSNFGSVQHPRARKVARAVALARTLRPGLEIDGEMRPEMAIDQERRREHYPFSTLTGPANVLVFPSLEAANASYQTLKAFGGATAIGPILLGLAKPCVALPLDSSVEDIVNMTAYLATRVR
jgi:malate dehydrogenase (oxaloacetate-decarboxylating)(NADP+)